MREIGERCLQMSMRVKRKKQGVNCVRLQNVRESVIQNIPTVVLCYLSFFAAPFTFCILTLKSIFDLIFTVLLLSIPYCPILEDYKSVIPKVPQVSYFFRPLKFLLITLLLTFSFYLNAYYLLTKITAFLLLTALSKELTKLKLIKVNKHNSAGITR